MSSPRHPATRLDGLGLSLIRQIFDAAGPDAVNLGLGETDFATPEPIMEAARQALKRPRLGYTANAGLPELRERLAEEHDVAVEQVCVTIGSTQAIHATMLAWLGPGDEVLVPDPGYPTYAAAAQIAGAEPVAYPLSPADGFAFDCESLTARVSPATRAVVINNPSNPAGRIAPLDELEKLAAVAADNDLLVISDEVYREIYFGDPPPSWLDVSDGGVVVGGLSKALGMSGWRLGWAVGASDTIAAITLINQYAVTCAPTLSQHAALAAFGDEMAARLGAHRAALAKRRDLMRQSVVAGLDCRHTVPEGAYYLMIEVTPDEDSRELADALLSEAGVIVVPGAAFGKEARGWLRLSFAAEEAVVREGMERLISFLAVRNE